MQQSIYEACAVVRVPVCCGSNNYSLNFVLVHMSECDFLSTPADSFCHFFVACWTIGQQYVHVEVLYVGIQCFSFHIQSSELSDRAFFPENISLLEGCARMQSTVL